MRILVVDDEPIQRRVLCRELTSSLGTREEFAVFEASNGKECLDMIEKVAPDLVFLDLRMPVLGGMDVARALEGRDTPRIIILSAFDDFAYAQEAIQLGVVSYLLKPFNSEEVRKAVRDVEESLQQKAKKQSEHRRLVAKLTRVRPIIASEYVNEIISGLPIVTERLREKEEILGISVPLSRCILIDVGNTPDQVEAERQWQMSVVHDALQDILCAASSVTSRIGFGRIACFLGGSYLTSVEDDVKEAEKIRLELSRHTQGRITVAVSRAEQVRDLTAAYGEAYQALEHAHLLGGGRTIHFEQIELSDMPTRGNDEAPDRLLADAVRIGDVARVRECLSSIYSQLHNDMRPQAKGACLRAVEILTILCRNAIAGGAPEETVWELGQSAVARLLKCQGSKETAAELQAVSEGLLDMIGKVRNVRVERMMAKAADYVRQHHAEALTLETVARQVYLSPFYFSHVFRQEMGQTFVEYLTQVRVQAAEQLLKDSVMSVGAISERVGYNDVNYFSRVFKKVNGLTPTQFRKRNFRGA